MISGERLKNCCQVHWNGFFYFLSPLVILPLVFLKPELQWRAIFLILWSFIWYSVDVVPAGVTGLLPIIFLPILGIMASKDVCMSYARDSQMLFLLTNFIAATMQYCEVVQHFAFFVLSSLSCDPKRILVILMTSSYLFTALLPQAFVCAIMIPTVRAILKILDDLGVCKSVDETKEIKDDETPYPSKVANAFYLGVAFAINIGSITTAIASESGMTLKDLIKNNSTLFHLHHFFHLKYILISLPVSLMLLVFTIYYLEIIFLGYIRSESTAAKEITFDKEASAAALEMIGKDLPPFNSHMILVSALYVCCSIGIIIGSFLGQEINDKILKYSFNSMLLCFFYFVLPRNFDFCNYFQCRAPKQIKTSPSILTWAVANKLTPWKCFLIYGSSSAFGLTMKNTDLHYFLGNGLLKMNSFMAQQLCFIGLTMILSIIGSNSFVADIMLNMGLMAVGDKKAAMLLYPITWACSLTFLLPVSSAANCFAGGWGNLRAKDMILAGLGPTVFGFLMAFLVCAVMGFSSLYG